MEPYEKDEVRWLRVYNLSSRLSSWEWTKSVLTIGLKRKCALKKQEISIVKHNENLVRG